MNDTETLQASLTDEIDIGRYLTVFARWWRLILACAILGALAAFGFGLVSAKSYEANAYVVLVRTSTIVNLDSKIRTVSNTDPTSGQILDQASLRKALASIANSEDIAQVVYNSLQTQLAPGIEDAGQLHRVVDVTNDGDTIQVTVRSKDPAQAALIANTWSKEFVTRANSIYSDSPISVANLVDQVQTARNDYDAKEAALVAFVRDGHVQTVQRKRDEKSRILQTLVFGKTTAVQAVLTETQQVQIRLLRDYLSAIGNTRSTVFTQQVTARTQKLVDSYSLLLKLERLLGNAQALRARMAQSSSQVQPGTDLALVLLESSAFTTWAELPVSLQIPITELNSGKSTAEQLQALDSLIAEIQTQHTSIQKQIDDASRVLLSDTGYAYLDANTSDPSSPLSAAIQSRVQALLNLDGLEDIASYESSDAAVVAAIDTLQKDINGLNAEIEVENAKQRDLTRARDLAWDTYTALANKVAESQVTADSSGSIVRVAASAVPPTQPVASGLSRTALGLLLGLFVGTALAFILEFFVTAFPDASHVKRALNLPTLATIPAFKSAPGQANLPRPVLEALRGLRFQLFDANKARAVMVTSALAGEGVTTTASNLATVAAQGGMNVLLIDANLREPTVHSKFNLEMAPGLSNLLTKGSGTDLQSGAYTHAVNANLSVLTAGSPESDPAAVLQHKTFEFLIQHAKEKFDLVIMDAPPVNGTIDAMEITRVADGVLLVIDSADTPRAAVLDAKAELAASATPILGAVLNRTGRVTADETRGAKSDAVPSRTMLSGLRTWFLDLVGPRSGT